jgi:hypothetical protein
MKFATNLYGLRAAKRIVRNGRATVKGETDPYAKGFRAALRQAEFDIQAEIEEIRNFTSAKLVVKTAQETER